MKFKTIFAALLLAASLPGCLPVLATGTAVGVTSTIDRRSYGTQLEDTTIETRLSSQLADNLPATARTSVTSYNRIVLLTGQVPNEAARVRAGELVGTIQNSVRGIHNELTISPAISFGTRTNDTYLTTAVRTRLLKTKDVNSNHFKIVTENSVVYLMGLLTQSEADLISGVIAKTDGVRKVVVVAEILSTEQAYQLDRPAQNTQSTATPTQ
ncbi:MAG: BON domain-containing protein [Betaproteobacteria bacterium]|nr:BON domain-containing protein [Betaproteobacteria bacterium]